MNKFSKKTILLVALILTMTVFSCINVSAATSEIRPLNVQISTSIAPGAPGGGGGPSLPLRVFVANCTSDASFIPTNSTYVKYSWDFGDGCYSSSERPMHVYARPGRYVVRVNVEYLCPNPEDGGATSILYSGQATTTITEMFGSPIGNPNGGW